MSRLATDVRALCTHDVSGYCNCVAQQGADEIERLEKRLDHYISVWSDSCDENQGLRNEIERLEKELAMFKDAVEHCTDPNYTKRSISASDGWTMISSEFYFDLVMAYNDTVRKEYRKQVLLEAAEFFGDSEVTAILRGMAEE